MTKWIWLILLMLPTVWAEVSTQEFVVGKQADLSVHISSDTSNCVPLASPNIYVWNESWDLMHTATMNELGGCWYNHTAIFNKTGLYHAIVNLTYQGVNGTTVVDFRVVEDESMQIAIAIVLVAFAAIFIALALFIWMKSQA